jgi:hypothetical protein
MDGFSILRKEIQLYKKQSKTDVGKSSRKTDRKSREIMVFSNNLKKWEKRKK